MTTFPIASLSAMFFSTYGEADFFGRLIILGLVGLSLLSWLILAQKMWEAKEVKKISNLFFNQFSSFKAPLLTIDENKLPRARELKALHPYFFIFKALKEKTLEILEKNAFFLEKSDRGEKELSVFLSKGDLELVESHLLSAVSEEIKKLEKNIFILPMIVTLAPFLGLLGTVWGILLTFSGLQAGGFSGSNSAILGGLSTALVTTVLGLVIAIPALIGAAIFKASIKDFSTDLERFMYELLGKLELEYRRVEVDTCVL